MSITDSPVVELRQYVLKPGAADALVEVFEAEFVESQEALGMAIGGLFHDRDDADRFVWMRGFASMEARRDALACVLRRAGLEAARPGRQRHDGRQRRRAAAAADGPAAPAARARPARAGRGHRDRRRVGRRHRLAARARPGHLLVAGGVRPAAAGLGPRDDGRHLAHRARREHLPRAARSAPTTRSSGRPPSPTTRRTPPPSAPSTADPAWLRTMTDLDARGVLAETLRLRPTARSSHPPPG